VINLLRQAYPELTWNELKRLVLQHYSPELIGQVAEVLKHHHYERIARIPAQKDVLSGLPREPSLLFNSLWGSKYKLFSTSACPALHRFVLEKRDPHLNYLFRVMFLNERTTRPELQQQFPDPLIDRLVETKALDEANGSFRFTLSFAPFKHLIIARDAFHIYRRDSSHHFKDRVWLGPDSTLLAHFLHSFLSGQRFKKVLEIGVGTGIQILIAAQHADRAVGVDINKRAIAFAEINAQMNRVRNVEFIPSNLFENVHGKFDLILANPWYCDLKSGGLEEIPGILDGLDDHLRDNGLLIMLTDSYVKAGRDIVLEKVKGFLQERRDYDLEARVIGYNIDRGRYQQYKQHGIAYCLNYFMILRKGGTGKIQRREASFLRRLRDFSYIQVAKTVEAIS
jgi:SAM-dependent methyltransferase